MIWFLVLSFGVFRFRYSLDEATGMYRVQLYRFELQDEEKDGGNLEIDTEVESVYQVINNNFLKEIKYHNFINFDIEIFLCYLK